MVFSSSIFLFLFLPLFIGVYYLVPRSWRTGWILVGSCAFFGWWRYDFLLLMLAVTLWSWAWAWVLISPRWERWRRSLAALALSGPLGILALFKYADFAAQNLNALGQTLGLAPLPEPGLLLPVGISFYTFQALSYLIDVMRRDVEPEPNPLRFTAFIVLFPQLIAGPVLRYKDVVDQFAEREHSLARFSEGAQRFFQGFCMKVLVADVAAPVVELCFDQARPTLAEAWLGALAYTVQLYFDFAGYSHMAVGLGLMIGFRFMENFDQPYLATSITDFWRRWHISLSTWLRDYLYIPLGGNRGGEAATRRNLLLTMVLGGLWHGANWTFVAWGAWHGLWLVAERRWRPQGSGALAIARTMLLVAVGWVFFRARDLGSAFDMFGGMLGLHGLGLRAELAWQIPTTGLAASLLGLMLIYGESLLGKGPSRAPALALSLLFALAVLRLSALSHSPFLYFQF
jgi:alginate O-acetyltransferase complex protein AlgI